MNILADAVEQRGLRSGRADDSVIDHAGHSHQRRDMMRSHMTQDPPADPPR